MSLLTKALFRAALLPWVDRVLDELVEDDGTEAYSFDGPDEDGNSSTFVLRPAAFRACVAAIRMRMHAVAGA